MRLFQLQRISAVALLVFLTIHMMVLHYPPFHIDFSRILERMADPLWKAIDIAFLFFVLMHALAGIHAVLTDFDAASRWHKLHAAVMAAIGIAAFLYGTATILAFQPPV
jgi:succinate dehydrogenase / fumarate reductase membrane anchor subunit